MKSRLSEHLDAKLVDGDFIPTDFSIYAKNQVSNIINRWINDQAINRQNVEAITIDWVESMDLDDAIWAEKTKNGYCVWGHISDVSEYIPIYSPLDIEAFKRTTSIYRKDHIINMIPEELSNWILSLNQSWEKKVVTLQVDLDNDCNINNYMFYESNLINLKRYDYSTFWEDFQNRDSCFYETIHLLQEISNKLLINRLKVGSIIWYIEEDRRIFIWEKKQKINGSYSEKISHSIIESFMVLFNTITWRYFYEKEVDAIYKNHIWLDERSFYTTDMGLHSWLWVNNYTHFTSPIRRYIDIIIHRIIKTIERWDVLPYTKSDLDFISDHSNNTRLKIEVLWSQLFFELKWEKFLEETRNRLGQEPEVHDLKDFIRESVSRWKKMPKCMKEAIKQKIETSSVWVWWWCVWVILFWKDKELKEYLKEKFLSNRLLRPWKILHLITQTQILRWEESIFELHEIENSNKYSVEILLHWNKIVSYSCNTWRLWDINQIKWKVRLEAIRRIFDYFINL